MEINYSNSVLYSTLYEIILQFSINRGGCITVSHGTAYTIVRANHRERNGMSRGLGWWKNIPSVFCKIDNHFILYSTLLNTHKFSSNVRVLSFRYIIDINQHI